MDRTADGVGPGPGENDVATLAWGDIAGVSRELRRIDKGMVDELLVIGEVNDAASAYDDPRRREQPVGLAYLELGAQCGAGRKTEGNNQRQ